MEDKRLVSGLPERSDAYRLGCIYSKYRTDFVLNPAQQACIDFYEQVKLGGNNNEAWKYARVMFEYYTYISTQKEN